MQALKRYFIIIGHARRAAVAAAVKQFQRALVVGFGKAAALGGNQRVAPLRVLLADKQIGRLAAARIEFFHKIHARRAAAELLKHARAHHGSILPPLQHFGKFAAARIRPRHH